MNVIYALKRLVQLDFRRAFIQLDKTAKKSGKSKIFIFFDMIWCGLRYGAGPNDYKVFEFYNLKHANRKTFITRGVNNALVRKFNDKKYWHLFDNKEDFNQLFAEFMHRDWLVNDTMTKEEFKEFLKGKKEIIYKPSQGTCGIGVEKFSVTEADADGLYKLLSAKEKGVIEEVVYNHHAIREVYPHAVNTVRVVTILKDGVCYPISAFWRIGMDGKSIDNLTTGGMAAKVDIETGTVPLPAADKNGIVYEKHPMTGKDIVGFTIPCWDKVLETVDKAARVVPQIAYVGWDVCVRENDILLIEGNSFPGHDILQLPAYTPDKIGLMDRVYKFYKN